MNRIQDILQNARDTLADQDKTRWSDGELLRALSEGQNNIAIKTQMFIDDYFVLLESGVSVYRLPENVLEIILAVQKNSELGFVTTKDLNKLHGKDWRCDYGEKEVKYLVTNKLNPQTIRVYPIPFFDDVTQPTYADVYGVTDYYGTNPTQLPFGVLATLVDPCTNFVVDEFGVVNSVQHEVPGIVIKYVKGTPKITGLGDSLLVPSIYDEALKHYVVGKVLRNNTNSQHRQFGGEELMFYNDILQEIMDASSKDYLSNERFTTSYNGLG